MPKRTEHNLEELPDLVLDRILSLLDAGALRNVLSLPNQRIRAHATHAFERINNLIVRSRTDWYPKPPVEANDKQLQLVLRDVFWLCQLNIEYVPAHCYVAKLSQLIARPYHPDTEDSYRQLIGHLYFFLIKVCMPPEPLLQFPRRTDPSLRPPPSPACYRTIDQHLDDFDIIASETLVLEWLGDMSSEHTTYWSTGSSQIPSWMLYTYTNSCILKSVLPSITRLDVRCPPKRMWESLPHFEQLASLRVSNMRSDDLQKALHFVAEHGQLRRLRLEGLKPNGWPARWHDLNVPIVRAMRQLQNDGQQPLVLSDMRVMPVQELVVNSCTFLSNETMQQLLSHLPELRSLSLDGHTIESPVQRDANNLGYDPLRYMPPLTPPVRQYRRRRRFRLIWMFMFIVCILSALMLFVLAVCFMLFKRPMGFRSDDY